MQLQRKRIRDGQRDFDGSIGPEWCVKLMMMKKKKWDCKIAIKLKICRKLQKVAQKTFRS